MSACMTPDELMHFRNKPSTPVLNWAQKKCKGLCNARRSVGQFNKHPEICDKCYMRMPKAA